MTISTEQPAKPPSSRSRLEAPRSIRLHKDDNVAIIVNAFGLPANTTLPGGLVLREFIPQGHKVALIDLDEGAAIKRYGEVIGHAAQPIAAAAGSMRRRFCCRRRRRLIIWIFRPG